MSLDDAIIYAEDMARINEVEAKVHKAKGHIGSEYTCIGVAEHHRQVAEWLRELKAYREFADWLVKAILEDDWEESADFYAEVLCRKLTKLGKLKVVDNKYVEVNADDDT